MAQPSDIADWTKWLYENGIFSFAQAILVVGGLVFTGIQLRLARRSFQATVVGQVSDRSSRLQWDVMKDPDLQELLNIPSATSENATAIAKLRRERALGLILNHFAHIYDLRELGGIPDEIWSAFEADLGTFVSRPEFGERWSSLKAYHRPEFVGLVERLMSEKPKLPGATQSAITQRGQSHEGN
jgi:hypothetical protein